MEADSSSSGGPILVGRYELYDRIASGGMAAVHLGRLAGPVGFTRTVAIKRLHPQFAADPEFVTMFLDEARLAARIQHPNVVPTIDVVATNGELFLVMEYVRGETASVIARRANEKHERIPPRIVAAIVSGALQGLHAAHEARDESHKPLGIVHRDVSPQNILVGLDGTPRVLDFGVAKAEDKFHSTRGGEIKGKILYMSPEQLEADALDRTTDIYAMGLVLFELLTGRRMFTKSQDSASIGRILRNELTMPSQIDASLARWDAVVRGASTRYPHERFPSARAMAVEVERVVGAVASTVEVADYVERVAGEGIMKRTKRIVEIESGMRAGREQIAKALANELARSSGNLPRVSGDEVSSRSERSQVSLARTDRSEVARAPKRSRWWFVAVVVALAAVVGGAFAIGHATSSSAPAIIAATTTATAEPKPTVTAVPPPTYADPPPATASTAAPAATTKPAIAATTTKTAAPAAAKPNCERPYTVDSAGRMHFRTECM